MKNTILRFWWVLAIAPNGVSTIQKYADVNGAASAASVMRAINPIARTYYCQTKANVTVCYNVASGEKATQQTDITPED